ncbi:MAG: hypothetical protein PHG67_06040 [Bacteroidales bacterium]|jgi:hypothetical protein|nr:hypothetical protein [Bacteroidales bacterium]HOI31201.1 hypothetical protein [Bacteroidales bacterium]
MRTFTFTAASFQGEVIIEFNDDGILQKFDSSGANMSAAQQKFLLTKLPIHVDDVKRVLLKSPTAVFTEIHQEVSFDQFWNRYDEKVRSSRKRSEKVWKRLSKTDKLKAYRYIAKYEQSLYAGIPKKYAETYLNAELWNN